VAQNPGNDPEISLTIFSGLVTYMDPVSLPQGGSPDCSDMVFQPGGVQSRPALQRLLPGPLGGVTITYGKSYVDNTGTIRNLFLDSAGILWVNSVGVPFTITSATNANPVVFTLAGNVLVTGQVVLLYGGTGVWAQVNGVFDVTVISKGGTFSIPVNSSGFGPVTGTIVVVAVALAATTPGSYAKSITADGREFIAISDGLHGSTIPLQLDYDADGNAQLDRVTQDGPACTPTLTNLLIAATSITTIQRSANVVTVDTSGAHGLSPGYQAQMSLLPAAVVGGTIVSIVINNEQTPGVATVTTSAPHGLIPENFVTIAGVVAASISNVIALYREGEVVTVVTGTPHGLSIGSSITIPACPNDLSFEGSFLVQFVPSPIAFTHIQADVNSRVNSPGGTVVEVNWPLPATETPTLFEVQSAPDPDDVSDPDHLRRRNVDQRAR